MCRVGPHEGGADRPEGPRCIPDAPIPTQVPNGLPTASRPNTPILIETKEPNGGTHTTTEEPEEQEGEVRTQG